MYSLPKRRKYRDNPYTLKTIDNHYYILFRDGLNIPRTIEVEKRIFDLFNQFELDDIHELNEYDRHIEHKELTEESMYNRGVATSESIDDLIIRKSTYEELMSAINLLSNTQKRRIKMYYFDEMNEYEIAKFENTSQPAIHKSIVQAKDKLKEILKK